MYITTLTLGQPTIVGDPVLSNYGMIAEVPSFMLGWHDGAAVRILGRFVWTLCLHVFSPGSLASSKLCTLS